MALAQAYYLQDGPFRGDSRSSYISNHTTSTSTLDPTSTYNLSNHYNYSANNLFNYNSSQNLNRTFRQYNHIDNFVKPEAEPSLKRRKCSASVWESSGKHSQAANTCADIPSRQPSTYCNVPSRYSEAYDGTYSTCNTTSAVTTSTRGPHVRPSASTSAKRDHSWLEDAETDVVFISRDEIERCSPSRKDGIDAMHEKHLRYSYCAFLQNLGVNLELPQTTIGTAMVLCHRFFIRRSHACHDRFLIATSALFLAAKSEETPCPLNNVLSASCELLHKQNFALLSYLLPVDWFEQFRERVLEAEQMILTTLNFELNVQHPYSPLTSTLEKLGFSQSVLVNLALYLKILGFFQLGCCFLSWLRSSLWLQFKPHQIAAGAAYLASKFLNMDLDSRHSVWKEFQTPSYVLRDVAQQLMELF